MNATLKFNLDSEEDKCKLNRILCTDSAFNLIYNMREILRQKRKYKEYGEEARILIENIEQRFLNELNDALPDFDNLWS